MTDSADQVGLVQLLEQVDPGHMARRRLRMVNTRAKILKLRPEAPVLGVTKGDVLCYWLRLGTPERYATLPMDFALDKDGRVDLAEVDRALATLQEENAHAPAKT